MFIGGENRIFQEFNNSEMLTSDRKFKKKNNIKKVVYIMSKMNFLVGLHTN